MKHYIYTVILILIGITSANAQRMVPKQKALEVSAGILSDDKIGNDYYINLAMTVNGKNGNYWLWALEYNHEYSNYKELEIPVETYMAEGGYSLRLLGNFRKSINLNATLNGVIG